MNPKRSEVLAAVDALRRAADHLERAESVEEATEAAEWASTSADDIRRMFGVQA